MRNAGNETVLFGKRIVDFGKYRRGVHRRRIKSKWNSAGKVNESSVRVAAFDILVTTSFQPTTYNSTLY